ncbi:MAG: hypothetical protein KAT81_05560, partial [Syntrophobacterales bacterium]|nr:hypothetical protein [Syntrophobacterales bacterium]
MKCYDEDYYELHEEDVLDMCFLCRQDQNPKKLFIVRQIASMKMIHLCPSCMVNNMSEFLLDNTRAWTSSKERLSN